MYVDCTFPAIHDRPVPSTFLSRPLSGAACCYSTTSMWPGSAKMGSDGQQLHDDQNNPSRLVGPTTACDFRVENLMYVCSQNFSSLSHSLNLESPLSLSLSLQCRLRDITKLRLTIITTRKTQCPTWEAKLRVNFLQKQVSMISNQLIKLDDANKISGIWADRTHTQLQISINYGLRLKSLVLLVGLAAHMYFL